MEKNNREIYDLIEEADKVNKERLQEIAELSAEEEKYCEALRAQEDEWFQEFANIVQEANSFFSIKHVDKLGLPYDICFFVAKKNIGKTWEIYRMMEEVIAKGKKFVYLRLSKDELVKSVEAFNNDSRSPVYMCKDKNTYKFYSKQDINRVLELSGQNNHFIRLTAKWLIDNNIDFKGYGFEFQFCQSYTGGEFQDFTTVFYDECLSYNPRNVLNDAHLANWGAFLSSISRNKKDLKVYMFGNLRDTNTQLLDFYGINRDDSLRYIVRGGDMEQGCRILYINAGELYRGIESQGRAARHSGGAMAYQLEHNDFMVTTNKLIPPRAFNLMDPVIRFAIGKGDKVPLLVDLRRSKIDYGAIQQTIWALNVEPLTGYEENVTSSIYAQHPAFFLQYANLSVGKPLFPYVKAIVELARRNKLRYLNEYSLMVVRQLVSTDLLGTMPCNKLGF